MDVTTYPDGTFALTKPITLAPLPPTGTIRTYTATGHLTLHGQTRPVTFPLKAERTANGIEVQGSIPVLFSKWGIPNPSFTGFVTTQNHGIVTTGPVHVARHGMFVTTPGLPGTLSSGYATVQVGTDVQNDGPAAATRQVAVTLTGPDGKSAGRGATTVSVPAGQTQAAAVSVKVTNPQLWSTGRPHLYTARTSLSVGGAVADSVSTPFGIRYATFDPAAGFSLNGQYMKIQGVDLHATEGAVGSAVRYDALVRQMRLMKSMGVNFLRTAHNPPAPELVAVCEQLGILMMVEAFDCWHTGKLPYDYHLYFDQWSDSDIKEMVNAAKNSPAVVLWSIGNETPDTGSSRGPGIARQLVADIKSIDTTRPVVMGSDKYRSVPATGSPQDLILAELDGLGVNYNTAMSMDGLHAKYPGLFFFCSEMGSETSSRGVYQDPQLLNTGRTTPRASGPPPPTTTTSPPGR